MEVEVVVNGGVKLVIIPQNEMEQKLLEELTNQDNDLVLAKEGIRIVDKQVPQGLIIQKKKGKSASEEDTEETDQKHDTEKEEEV